MVVLIDNIGAIEMLDSKTGQCKTKHIDTRFHWIKQYVDENKVKVKFKGKFIRKRVWKNIYKENKLPQNVVENIS